MSKFYKGIVIFSLILNIALGGAVFYLYKNINPVDIIEKNIVNTNITEFSSEVSHAIASSTHSVVSIKTNKQGIYSYGSGVIIGQTDGLVDIVTNGAVVNNAENLEVLFANGQSCNAILKGIDVVTDMALIQVNVEYDVPIIKFGASKMLKLGQFISVIGGSTTSLTNNATLGIVSALNNTIGVDLNQDEVFDWQVLTVQTDAGVTTANTGGAMVNLNGELVGIASYRLANIQGITNGSVGVGIPVEEVVVICDQLKQYGNVTRALLGLNVIDIASLTTYQRSYLGVELDFKNGLYISSVLDKDAGSLAGLKPGDIIVAIDGIRMNGLKDYRKALYVKPDQETLSISYVRNDETNTVTLELNHD